jgi:hypothetical protein
MTIFLSAVSTTKMASSFAGSVSGSIVAHLVMIARLFRPAIAALVRLLLNGVPRGTAGPHQRGHE